MASVIVPSVICENARILETFMGLSDDVASFLDCFAWNHGRRACEVALVYYKNDPTGEERRQAQACAQHLKRLFPAKPVLQETGDTVELKAMIDLSNPNLKNTMIELMQQILTEQNRPATYEEIESALPMGESVLVQGFNEHNQNKGSPQR